MTPYHRLSGLDVAWVICLRHFVASAAGCRPFEEQPRYPGVMGEDGLTRSVCTGWFPPHSSFELSRSDFTAFSWIPARQFCGQEAKGERSRPCHCQHPLSSQLHNGRRRRQCTRACTELAWVQMTNFIATPEMLKENRCSPCQWDVFWLGWRSSQSCRATQRPPRTSECSDGVLIRNATTVRSSWQQAPTDNALHN